MYDTHHTPNSRHRSAPSTSLLNISSRRLSNFRFWLSNITLAKKLAVVAVVMLTPPAVALGLFMSPQSVTFSFAGETCFSNPSLFPNINKPSAGNTFSLDQKPAVSLGSTSILSSETCVQMHSQPEKNVAEQLSIKAPLGISKSIAISVDSIPELVSSQTIDPNISQQDSLTFQLTTTDSSFSYSLIIADTTIDCTVSDTFINCPLTSLQLDQGQAYPYTLRRHLGGSHIELFSDTAQTSEPITIEPGNIQPDQTVITHITAITLNTNKPAINLGGFTLTHDGTSIPVNAQADGTIITITADDALPRSTSFVLTVPSLASEDGGFLQQPYTLTFATSGGPRVSTINIEKTSVPVHSNITAAMNIDLLAGQNASSLASVTIGGQTVATSVSYSGRHITINPVSNLPKCTEFTVHIAAGSVSIHGVGGGSAWSYTARTACYETFSIGSSVNGRSILAYRFGAGSSTTVFIGGTHGDERSSTRTLNAWIDELDAQPTRIPANKTIVVIPNLNPDGYASGSRANARGVDLNRNFPSNDWTNNVYQPGNILLENGGGTSALSEPESAALASYIQSTSPSLVLTYHAVARTVIYNGSGSSASLASTYGSLSGFGVISSSAEDSFFSYPTTGEFEAWLYDKLGVPALLIENSTMRSNEIGSQRSAMWAMIEN